MPEQGDIVLIPVPFTDLTSHKRRPVIVVSNDEYNGKSADMIVVAMTSNPAPSEYGFLIDSTDLERGRLNHPGTVRIDKIYAISQGLIVKTFGKVKTGVLDRVGRLLQKLVVKSA
jgi:mRNA interferase MazF